MKAVVLVFGKDAEAGQRAEEAMQGMGMEAKVWSKVGGGPWGIANVVGDAEFSGCPDHAGDPERSAHLDDLNVGRKLLCGVHRGIERLEAITIVPRFCLRKILKSARVGR
jgi:hypothetical protein